MLVLTRKNREEIVIGEGIRLKVLDIKGDRVKLGVTAPADVTVHREEVYREIELDARIGHQESLAGCL